MSDDAERLARWNALLDEALAGIDEDQSESKDGWWSNSVGAEFGAAKLAELRVLFREALAGE